MPYGAKPSFILQNPDAAAVVEPEEQRSGVIGFFTSKTVKLCSQIVVSGLVYLTVVEISGNFKIVIFFFFF